MTTEALTQFQLALHRQAGLALLQTGTYYLSRGPQLLNIVSASLYQTRPIAFTLTLTLATKEVVPFTGLQGWMVTPVGWVYIMDRPGLTFESGRTLLAMHGKALALFMPERDSKVWYEKVQLLGSFGAMPRELE